VTDASSKSKPGAAGWLKLGALAALLLASTLAVKYSGIGDRVTVGQIHAVRDSLGLLAPLIYVVVYVVGTVLAFPGFLLTLVGGLLFGTLFGWLLVTVGASTGAILAFLVGRYAGRATIERFAAGGRLERFDRAVSGSGFSAVLFTRLVPVFPFNVVNYLWGLSGVGLRDYMLATVVGMIPAEFVYTNIGGAVARSLEGSDATLASIEYAKLLNRDVVGAFALLGVMALVPTVARLVRGRHTAAGAGQTDADGDG
jgi:uncharacterized membrane protein YdjX (TVP38/TMEM64 family)